MWSITSSGFIIKMLARFNLRDVRVSTSRRAPTVVAFAVLPRAKPSWHARCLASVLIAIDWPAFPRRAPSAWP